MSDLVLNKGLIRHTQVSNLISENKPIIFWDTCSLLYYNSLVDRRAYREYEWDKKIFDLVDQDKVYSVTSSVVYQEFDKHHIRLKNIDEEKENTLKSAMQEYGKIIGGQEKMSLKHGMDALRLSNHLDEMVCQIWKKTYVIEEDVVFHKKAHIRVLESIPPCSDKKQQYKDCYIWETYLSLCDNIPNKGMVFFMTENTEDYCEKRGGKKLLSEIQEDMSIHYGCVEITKRRLWSSIAKKLGLISNDSNICDD